MSKIMSLFRKRSRTPPEHTPETNNVTQNSHKMEQQSEMQSQAPSSSESQGPVTLIELFQSQGCSSCPPANSNAISLACGKPSPVHLPSIPANSGVDYLLLTYHVTYWDYIGWRDTFGNKAFDQRQRDYVRRMGLRSSFTPQIIVNGRSSGVGSSGSDLSRTLKNGHAGQTLPVKVEVSKDADGSAISVDARAISGQTVLSVSLVYFDPATVDVDIKRGENKGRTLPHLNIVKQVQKIGDVPPGKQGEFIVGRPPAGLRAAVLIQDGPGGQILGVSRV